MSDLLSSLKATISHSRSTSSGSSEAQTPPLSNEDNEFPASVTLSGMPRRRPRPASDDDGILDEREHKRLKSYAQSQCVRAGLHQESLNEFCEEPRLQYMLVNLLILLLVQDQKRITSHTKEILQSTEFKKKLHERLLMCILSPNLTAYLTGLPPRIMEIIRKDPDGFGLSHSMLNASGMFSTVQSLVCEELTSIRASIKQKLRLSMGGKGSKAKSRAQDIRTLVKALAPPGMDIKTTHWSRIAFLRCCLIDFDKKLLASPRQEDDVESSNPGNTNAGSVADDPDSTTSDNSEQVKHISVENRTYLASGYWKFVDDTLQEARMTIRKNEFSSADEVKYWTSFFTIAHQRDLVSFPTQDKVNTAGLTTTAGTSTFNDGSMTDASWQEQTDMALNW